MSSWGARDRPPKQRSERIVIRPLGDDVLVYDTEQHRAHSLTGGAAAVFSACDGRRSIDEIADAASDRLGEPLSPAQVGEVLTQLDELSLLETQTGYSRREIVRHAGLVGGGAAIGSAAISTIVVPTPAHAQTGPQGPQGSQGPQGPQGSQGL